MTDLRPGDSVSKASADAFDLQTRRAPLRHLNHGECRFPVNDAPEAYLHLFCGLSVQGLGSYCAHHAARARGHHQQFRHERTGP